MVARGQEVRYLKWCERRVVDGLTMKDHRMKDVCFVDVNWSFKDLIGACLNEKSVKMRKIFF